MEKEMKKTLLTLLAITFSAGSMAGMNDYEIKRGTMVCENKEAIERFLELKDNGVKRKINNCRIVQNTRNVEVDKRYPVKGYVKVKLDGKKVYVNKEALFRD